MSLITQLTIYAATIASMLTFMRLISGISGSQMVRMSILKTAFISTVFIVIVGFVKILMNFALFNDIVKQNIDLTKDISTGFFLIWAVLSTYYFGLGVIVRLYARTFRFKDWGTVKNLRAVPFIKMVRNIFRFWGDDKRDYETNPAKNINNKTTETVWSKFVGDKRSKNQPTIITSDDPWKLRKKIILYCVDLIRETNEDINYVCCNVSPDNIWNIIKNNINDENLLNKLKKRLVFVDAYTTTFGFEDEILKERTRILTKTEHVSIVSCDSSAGIHSGTAKAFKILKQNTTSEKGTRRPCTVIYDSLSIMSIPETEDEVSEFIIHLTAAELTYDMHTIFIEADFENRENETLDAMKACCGSAITVDNNDN